MEQPHGCGSPKNCSSFEFGAGGGGTGGVHVGNEAEDVEVVDAVGVVQQAGGSCDTNVVRDVMVERVVAGEETKVDAPARLPKNYAEWDDGETGDQSEEKEV